MRVGSSGSAHLLVIRTRGTLSSFRLYSLRAVRFCKNLKEVSVFCVQENLDGSIKRRMNSY